uniref:sugar ABC transporter substrate-binding protein n=1 Tax=Neorhizobium sp. EC2-8 TaxID=3129230 RepID=UPI0031019AAB
MKFGKLAVMATAMTLLASGVTLAGEVTWWTPNFNEARARELVTKFEQANQGIKVKLEITTADGLPQRVLTALQSGAAPEIIDVQHAWINGYAQNDLVLPLDDVLKDRDDYIPASLEYCTWNGKLWGFPIASKLMRSSTTRAPSRMPALIQASRRRPGMSLVAAAKTLSKGKISGFAITGGGEVGNTIFRSLPFIWMNGGDIISADGKKAVVNQPAAVAAVKFYTDFFKNKQSPASTLENDGTANRRLFIAETVAAYQSGQFDVASIKKENPKIDIGVMQIPHPTGKPTAALLGGWSFVVPKSAKNPTEAKKLVAFLAEAANQGALTDTFPARKSAMSLPRFSDPILTVFKDMLPYGRAVPNNKNWVQITQAYFDGIQRILLGDEDAQKAMDGAAKDIQALLDQK